MQSLRYLNSILTVLAVLLALNVWTMWRGAAAEMVGPIQSAQAAGPGGIPNAGAQRKQIIDQLKSLNAKTDSLTSLLKSGTVRVRVQDKPEAKRR